MRKSLLYIAFGIADRYTADVKALDALAQSLRSEASDMRAGLEVKISQMLLQQEELLSVQSKAEQKAAELQVKLPTLCSLQPTHFTSSHPSSIVSTSGPRSSDSDTPSQHRDHRSGDLNRREMYV